MKKTSIALMMALFAIGCGGTPPAKPAPAASNPDMMMKAHQAAKDAEKKDADKKDGDKKDGDTPAADTPAGDGDKTPAADDKKDKEDTPAEPK